jgi:hypothetical protein
MNRLLVGLRIVAALLTMVVVASPSFAQTNMLANAGFEDGGGSYNGWFTFGSGVQLSLPGGDNIIRTGVAASKTYGGFTGCPIPTFNVGGYGQAFTAPVIGDIFELGGYSFVSIADTIPGTNTCQYNRMIAKVVFFNATSGGSEISSNEIIIGDWDTPRNQWIEFSVSAPAPPGALRVEALFLFLQPGCDAGSVFVDDTWFYERSPVTEPNVLVNPSFNTNLTGWTKFGNVYYDGRVFARRTPTGSAKLYSTFNAGYDSGMFQKFAAAPGSIWKMGAYALTTCMESPIYGTNDNHVIARIVFFDATSAEVGSSEAIICNNASPLGTWTHHELVIAAPAGTDSLAAYILFISPTLQGGATWVDDISLAQIGWSGVDPVTPTGGFKLHQNIPNPFNPTTRIDFDLEKSGTVDLSVYDAAGHHVATLFRGHLAAGPHQLTWDGMTAGGSKAASGVYLYVLKTEMGQMSHRMVLLR